MDGRNHRLEQERDRILSCLGETSGTKIQINSCLDFRALLLRVLGLHPGVGGSSFNYFAFVLGKNSVWFTPPPDWPDPGIGTSRITHHTPLLGFSRSGEERVRPGSGA